MDRALFHVFTPPDQAGVVSEGFDPRLGVGAGSRVDVPAWLARIHRVPA